jgi:hypothetical protein
MSREGAWCKFSRKHRWSEVKSRKGPFLRYQQLPRSSLRRACAESFRTRWNIVAETLTLAETPREPRIRYVLVRKDIRTDNARLPPDDRGRPIVYRDTETMKNSVLAQRWGRKVIVKRSQTARPAYQLYLLQWETAVGSAFGAFPELNSTVAGSFRAARLQARVVTNGQNFTSIDVERFHRTEEFVIRRSSECYCETRRTDVAVQPISHGLSCARHLLPSLLEGQARKSNDILFWDITSVICVIKEYSSKLSTRWAIWKWSPFRDRVMVTCKWKAAISFFSRPSRPFLSRHVCLCHRNYRNFVMAGTLFRTAAMLMRISLLDVSRVTHSWRSDDGAWNSCTSARVAHDRETHWKCTRSNETS